MLNFLWLDDFLELAATGNFSRAAQERHMTQPAFSRRIRALEEWVGAELFDRSTQPARLTEVGEWFRNVAEELIARVARVPGEARRVSEASSVTLRMAVFTAHLASVLRTMVLDGRGVAWLPRTLVEEDVAAGRLVPAAEREWNIPVEIRLYRERNQASKAAEGFWDTAVRDRLPS